MYELGFDLTVRKMKEMNRKNVIMSKFLFLFPCTIFRENFIRDIYLFLINLSIKRNGDRKNMGY